MNDHAAAGPVEAAPEPASYPSHWEADVVLRDGRTCHIRPIRPDDKAALMAFNEGLSEETLYMRFFTASKELSERDMERLLKVDHRDRVGILAMVAGAVVGVGNYDSVGRAEAEIAFTISDDHQGRGLGSVLLEHLAAIARENGFHRFKAEVLSANKKMLATFTAAGYTPTQELEEGIVLLDFDIDPTVKSRKVARAREHRAEALSIQKLVAPTSVAVICESTAENSIGATTLANLREGGYAGRISVVTPGAEPVEGAGSFPSLLAIGTSVDLVIMALPPDQVEGHLADCAACEVRGIVLFTGGFIQDDDYSPQQKLVRQIRELGMRLVGPNALGLINTEPGVHLNASLVPEMPPRGRIGFFCQTGAFGTAILKEAGRRGLGVSTFISAGNRADVSANDMLQYWEDDDSTSLVLLYLESIGNPRKFTRIARRLALGKPVVAVRSGRSTQALPLGHAVRRTDLAAEAIDAMFEQAGVIQVDSLTELLDLAGLLAFQPRPTGNRVAIVSDSDALGVLAIDASSSLGLEPAGPVRLVDTGGAVEDHERVIAAAIADPGVDAVVVTHIPPVFGTDDALFAAMIRQARDATKPVIAVVLAHRSEPLTDHHTRYGVPGHGSVPVFADVEGALRALRAVVRYSAWLAAPRGSVPHWGDLEQQRAHRLAVEAVAASEHPDISDQLSQDTILDILDGYGIEVWPAIPVGSEEEAVAAAAQVGYPVVIKSTLDRLVHRTDWGGLRLTLENEQAVRTAYLSMVATLPAEASGRLVVQRMAPPGVACVASTTEDPLFGPVVSFRLGGIYPQLLGDIAYRIPPLTDQDARALVRGPRSSPLLFGGGPGALVNSERVDIAALEDLLARLGQLADDLPEVAELELNPIIAHPKGVAVLAVNGRVARPLARTDLEARRLL